MRAMEKMSISCDGMLVGRTGVDIWSGVLDCSSAAKAAEDSQRGFLATTLSRTTEPVAWSCHERAHHKQTNSVAIACRLDARRRPFSRNYDRRLSVQSPFLCGSGGREFRRATYAERCAGAVETRNRVGAAGVAMDAADSQQFRS